MVLGAGGGDVGQVGQLVHVLRACAESAAWQATDMNMVLGAGGGDVGQVGQLVHVLRACAESAAWQATGTHIFRIFTSRC